MPLKKGMRRVLSKWTYIADKIVKDAGVDTKADIRVALGVNLGTLIKFKGPVAAIFTYVYIVDEI
jgi:hypothetical protein